MNIIHKTILNKIIVDKINWINFYKKKIPIVQFKDQIKKSTRNFYLTLLQQKNKFFILECKKASPSQGLLRKNFNVKKIAKIYKDYATVISVVTDEKYFQGNFSFLKKISKLVKLPILCKDFIIDPWQVYFARVNNADAILLMMSILTNYEYILLSKIAHDLNMGIITEVINEKELYRAIKLKAKVIGINNRNLHDLSININRTCVLSKMIPKNNIIIISESGIKNYHEIKKLSKYVDGFLIGSALMKEKNIKLGINKIILGENKICGLNNKEDIEASAQAGAVYGGFIFITHSSRYITIQNTYNLICNNEKLLKYVGVFYNMPIKKIIDIIKFLNIKIIQLHGQENETYIKTLKNIINYDCVIWKAINMQTKNNLNEFIVQNTDRILLDNGRGGTGKTFDWSLINKNLLYKTILAGGLSLSNCSEASNLGCAGLDFNSGIEVSPGIKDHQKLFQIFRNLRKY